MASPVSEGRSVRSRRRRTLSPRRCRRRTDPAHRAISQAMNANIAGWLHQMAQAHAKMPAIIEPRSIAKPVARTFEYVSGECDFVNAKLVGKGVTVGSRVALMVPPGEQFVEYTFS